MGLTPQGGFPFSVNDTPYTPNYTEMEMNTKLCTAREQPLRRLHTMLDRQGDANLADCRRHYVLIAGRAVSTSVIIRRALALLTDHLDNIEDDEKKRDTEVFHLMDAVR